MATFIVKPSGLSSITNLTQYINFYNIRNITNIEFLNIIYKGKTNRQRIIDSFVNPNTDTKNSFLTDNPFVCPATILAIPIQNIQRDDITNFSNIIYSQTNLSLFLPEKIKSIINSPSFRITTKGNTVIQQIPSFQVWVWCKTLNYSIKKTSGKGLLNVTAFVQNVETNVGDNGGNFSINFAPINAFYDSNGNLKVENTQIQRFIESGVSINTVINSKDGQSKFFINQLFSENDLVFIIFDDINKNDIPTNELFIPFDKLPFKEIYNVGISTNNTEQFSFKLKNPLEKGTTKTERNFSMIGLVDSLPFSKPNEKTVNTTVQGRDLMKLLIDDNQYFFPLSVQQSDLSGVFNNTKQQREGRESIRVLRKLDGTAIANQLSVSQTIPTILSYIFLRVSNIEICPDDVFAAWGSDRTKYAYFNNNIPDLPNSISEEIAAGIWAIIKLFVADDKANPLSSLATRRVVDASIADEKGSLLNLVNRVCDKPFSEFYGDVYGNQYYFIARKPPYTYEAYRALNDIADSLDREGQGYYHIRESDIISESISWYTDDVYSWYYVEPKGIFTGNSAKTYPLAFQPAVFFPEYAEIFGSKPYIKSSNWINYNGLGQTISNETLNTITKQCIEDLRFLVQINAYLPFTRKGNITVRGDNRYKKGMSVKHLGTNEWFIIDSVKQSMSISGGKQERSSTLTISRGMRDDIFDLYFKVINTEGDVVRQESNGSRFINWSVNREIFEFLMKRKKLYSIDSFDDVKLSNDENMFETA